MNHEQVGKYIRILCALHQNGRLMRSQIDSICGGITDECILAKLSQDDNGLYYNQRLDNEVEKRKLHSEKQKQNALMRWHKSGNAVAMPLENENEIENDNTKKAEKKIFVPPTLEQVIAYFDEKGYTAEHATRAFNHYDVANWHDAAGKPVKNWKQKMQTNWMKNEGKSAVNVSAKKSAERYTVLQRDEEGKRNFVLDLQTGRKYWICDDDTIKL